MLPLTLWSHAPLAQSRRAFESALCRRQAFQGFEGQVRALLDRAETWADIRDIRARAMALARSLGANQKGILDLVLGIGKEIGEACTQLIRVADDARESLVSAPACHMRVLAKYWAEALANGEKFVEFMKYKSKWSNQMRFAQRGMLLVVGVAGQMSVCAVAVLQGPARTKLLPECDELREAFQHVKSTHHDRLREFLDGAEHVDYVRINQVYDIRSLRLTWAGLAEILSMNVPRNYQGFPMLAQGMSACASRLLSVCGREGVVVRRPMRD